MATALDVCVAEVMTDDVVWIDPEASLAEAVQRLLKHDISGLPVTDLEGNVVGMLSELDLLRYLRQPKRTQSESAGAPVVRDYMTTPAVTIDAGASIQDAIDIFLEESIRRLPVLRDGHLVGIVGRRDLMRLVITLEPADVQPAEVQPA